jgi:3-oxoacyl-[acyl-carrier protein] reductase
MTERDEDNMALDDKVIAVTGAGSGIGAAIARKAARRGARVALLDVNDEAANRVAAELEHDGLGAMALYLDVADRASWQSAIDAVIDRWGRLDGLVNNAGITRDRTVLKLTDDDWNAVMSVNLTGMWIGCQTALPHLQACGGAIVNTSSESRHGVFGQANYAAAKAGVVGLTRTIAIEQARKGVRCNAIAPGTIDTPMVAAVPADVRESWLDNIPMGRFGQPEEVAEATLFLLSTAASIVTGQVLCVNGGSSQ